MQNQWMLLLWFRWKFGRLCVFMRFNEKAPLTNRKNRIQKKKIVEKIVVAHVFHAFFSVCLPLHIRRREKGIHKQETKSINLLIFSALMTWLFVRLLFISSKTNFENFFLSVNALCNVIVAAHMDGNVFGSLSQVYFVWPMNEGFQERKSKKRSTYSTSLFCEAIRLLLMILRNAR